LISVEFLSQASGTVSFQEFCLCNVTQNLTAATNFYDVFVIVAFPATWSFVCLMGCLNKLIFIKCVKKISSAPANHL